jgi:hypothetical protein
MKICRKCGEELRSDNFCPSEYQMASPICKKCDAALHRERYHRIHAQNKNKSAQQQKYCDDHLLYSKEWLYAEHVIKQRSLKDMGNELGCCYGTVRYNLKKFGIPLNGKAVGQNPNSAKITKEFLEDEYIAKCKPYSTIAEENGLSVQTICNYMSRYEIEPRDYVNCHLRDANGNWHGGLSFKKYCFKFNNNFKKHIREKFNFRCYLCGSLENGRKHCIHHIDYNRNSICNGHEWAFVPLCISCHAETNYNRWYWFNLLINYWATNPENAL